jgi:hypothetical protein
MGGVSGWGRAGGRGGTPRGEAWVLDYGSVRWVGWL